MVQTVDRQRVVPLTLLLAVSLVLLACRVPAAGEGNPVVSSPTQGATQQPTPTPSTERVDVTIRNATLHPVDTHQTELVVDLTVPDTCTEVRYAVTREGMRIRIAVWGERPLGVMCAQVLRDEQVVIPIGFAVNGGFVVELNGVELSPRPEENSVGEPGTGALDYGLASVEQVEIRNVDERPRHVILEIQGHLPDACAELGEHPIISIVGKEVTVQLEWERPRGLMCAQVLRPFTTSVDLGELEPGAYTLVVNDLQTTFEVE
ncbi:hypothetical protein NET03_04075 [Thermomicrobium sp. CFH 73360]|uniref:hypothetical protein n=1 Tax=Thermomicrobium sp. CFH 73360 TaxID=2951987 RepID=UPI0020766A0E|nr:hypothetical protein [Thermomicrobium sp. CFH 73360]MCM8745698.1 hypothetical protein [Thermomicrobium sp. CFH 73360]